MHHWDILFPPSFWPLLSLVLACQDQLFHHSNPHRQFPCPSLNYLSHDRLSILVKILLLHLQSARSLARVAFSP